MFISMKQLENQSNRTPNIYYFPLLIRKTKKRKRKRLEDIKLELGEAVGRKQREEE